MKYVSARQYATQLREKKSAGGKIRMIHKNKTNG